MSEFLTLLLVAVLAFLAPGISAKARLPVVVGEILLGLTIGLSNFLAQEFWKVSLVATGEVIDFLAEVGFVILLFLAGLEIDFNQIEERGITPVVMGVLTFVVTAGLAAVLVIRGLPVLGIELHWFLAIVLSSTGIDLVVTTLRGTRLHRGGFGQTVLFAAMVADFGTILLLTGLIYVATGSGGAWRLALVPLLFVAFFVVYRIGGWFMWHYPRLLVRFFRSEDPSEMGVRAALLVLFAFVVLSAAIGVEVILGAFLAGVMLSLLFRQGALLHEKLYGFGYGFFVPLFFIVIGLHFDFRAVADPSTWLILPALVAVAFIVKLVPALMYAGRYGVKGAMALGSLLSARLAILIAGASIALEAELIDRALYSAFILLAVVMATLGPVLFRVIAKRTLPEVLQ